jgi:hypothetical protein
VAYLQALFRMYAVLIMVVIVVMNEVSNTG